MNIDNQTILLIRATRGVPLTCLFVLFAASGPIGSTDIAGITGYARKTISAGLAALESLGMAAQVGRYHGWILTDRARQLPLPGLRTLKIEGENLPLAPLTTTTIPSSPPDVGHLVVAVIEGEKLPLAADALHALWAAGIRGKKADELAALAWVTPDYIAAHVAQVQRERQKLGLAIYRMQCGDPPPEQPECGCDLSRGHHDLNCPVARRRYAEQPGVQS